jgi:dienelactone hydrolase
MRMVTGLALLLVSAGCGEAPPAERPMREGPTKMAVTPVMFKADDGLTVSGNFYRADRPRAVILLFHQAGSSKEEYATIAPKLAAAGYSALAVDQRSGGSMFGTNETAARAPEGASYGDALHDLDGALTWARTMNLPVIIWGSSYSSSLVFALAAKRPGEVTAILSFSPGEYLGAGTPVQDVAARVKVPVFVTAAKDAGELSAARAIFDAVPSSDKVFATPAVAGVHGSSTLIDARNPKGASDNWQPVFAFLKKIAV